METVGELIEAFGGPAAFGRLLGKGASTASEMKRRASIPVEYWPKILEVAGSIGITLTYEMMVNMHIAASSGAKGGAAA